MNTKALRIIRDYLRISSSFLFIIIYIPHIFFYWLDNMRGGVIKDDVIRNRLFLDVKISVFLSFLYFIHTNAYFRSLFYYRIGAVKSSMIKWYRPGDKHFLISQSTMLGGGCLMAHPFSSVLNAEKIGRNLTVRNCTTIGYGKGGRPIIGNDVDLGVNVVIIGGIHIGNNVIVGAGSVVVKDVPDNCVIAGNPAKIIRYLNKE